jgi:hypothetical protein
LVIGGNNVIFPAIVPLVPKDGWCGEWMRNAGSDRDAWIKERKKNSGKNISGKRISKKSFGEWGFF